MTVPAPAVEDANWLEPELLYLTAGEHVERDRPIYQGDVFADVPVPILPDARPDTARLEVLVERGPVMVVPHPCQCYHGDSLRDYLTVAPVSAVANYSDFRSDRTGAKDKFALPDLPERSADGLWTSRTSVAHFGKIFAVPSSWLRLQDRVSCLSHVGLGLLAKRVLGFQLRCPITLAEGMAFTQGEWIEALLMQAWVRHRGGTLDGYSRWLKTPIEIPGVGADGESTAPYTVRAAAPDALLAIVTGEEVTEPGR